MPSRPTLNAEERTLTGKKVRALRRQGRLPAVVYGPVIPAPVALTLDSRDLDRTYHAYGSSTLVDVAVGEQTYTVYIRNVQAEKIGRAPIHAELFAPNLQATLDVTVALMLVGEATNHDGALTQMRDSIDLRGRPTEIPSAVEVDISGLAEVDDAINVGDLPLPEGVELLTDPSEPVVRIIGTRAMLAELEEEEAEREAAAEEAQAADEAEAKSEDEPGE